MARTDDCNSQDSDTRTNNDYSSSSYWKCIPDPPPTPNKESNKLTTVNIASATGGLTALLAGSRSHHRQERKRQSFAFRDVTNNPILKCDANNHHAAAFAKKSASSLSTLRGDARLCSNGVGDENSSTFEQRTNKRSRRQTMLLPSDKQDAMLPKTVTRNACDTRNCQNENSTTSNLDRNECTSRKSMVQLVRKYYYSQPNENRRIIAKEIESLSGYPMPGYVMNTHYTRSKEEFILKVQPVVQALEDRKQLDVLEAEEFTRCRVMKVGKEGFSYYDVSTGEQVEAREYKLRYAAMLDEKLRKRKEMASDDDGSDENEGKGVTGFCHFDTIHDVESTSRNNGVCDSSYGRGCNMNELNWNEGMDNSNMDLDEGVSMDESILSIDESIVSTAVMHGTPPSPSDEESPSKNTTSRIAIESFDGAESKNYQHEITDIGSLPHHPAALLDMPSSNDPRVLAARTRLWLAIDRALAAYSKEILEIQRGGDK